MGSAAPLDQPRAEEPGQLDPNTITMHPPLHTTLIAVGLWGSNKCVSFFAACTESLFLLFVK